jgi:hypothetical protein
MSFDPDCCSGRYRLDLSDPYQRLLARTLQGIPPISHPQASIHLSVYPNPNSKPQTPILNLLAACGNSENVRATRLGVADTSASGNRQRIVRVPYLKCEPFLFMIFMAPTGAQRQPQRSGGGLLWGMGYAGDWHAAGDVIVT